MPDKKTHHMFMQDERSLCDRRALSDATGPIGSGPVCGPCIVVMHSIRVNLLLQTKLFESVWPPTVFDAVELLKGTRWEGIIDFDAAKSAFGDYDLSMMPEHIFSSTEIEQGVAAAKDFLKSDENNSQ